MGGVPKGWHPFLRSMVDLGLHILCFRATIGILLPQVRWLLIFPVKLDMIPKEGDFCFLRDSVRDFSSYSALFKYSTGNPK
jgi:hypothetical protein